MPHNTDIFFFTIFIIMAVASLVLRRVYVFVNRNSTIQNHESHLEMHAELKTYANVFYFFALLTVPIYAAYIVTEKFQMEPHVMEWLNLILRWTHVVFGIAWIGASFYFIFLENSLNRTENLRDELAGNLWAIHGGGFYYVEKYKSAPPILPKHLHWFKYEAYFTWLSGFLLLTLVYFMNAKAMMLDSSISNIDETTAVFIGLGSLVVGWLIYDVMCHTALLQKKKLFGIIGFAIVVLVSYILCQFLNGRAAFILVGALMGTIMAGNVFFCIIPSQKALVAAAKANQPVNPELGKIAGLRSLHNNYITLPVIFIMISNHFPTTFGSSFNWIILAALTLASVAVRHYINLYEKGIYAKWMIPFATVIILSLVIVTAPKPRKLSNNSSLTKGIISAKNLPPVKFTEIQTIFKKRCIVCHSANPTDDVNVIAPNGIKFDNAEEIQKYAERIMIRVVQTETMPQGNKTNITDAERETIGVWIEQGAQLK